MSAPSDGARADARKRRCAEHGDVLIVEPGGPDMPTPYGRAYCPTCQDRLFIALDALDENR